MENLCPLVAITGYRGELARELSLKTVRTT